MASTVVVTAVVDDTVAKVVVLVGVKEEDMPDQISQEITLANGQSQAFTLSSEEFVQIAEVSL